MIEIIFLGTGCMQPTKERNHPGILLKYNREQILFDCGEGIQRQLRIAGLKPAKITRILISHWHGDHSFGLPGIMSAMWADQANHKVYIYGPTGSKKRIEHILKAYSIKGLIDFEVIEVKNGSIIKVDDFSIEVRKLDHSITCLGYKFIENDKLKINLKKAEKLGLKGPILGKLQKGENVKVDDELIKSKDVTISSPGKIISYVTDTNECLGAEKLAKNANLLICEATHLDELKEKTKQYKHLTATQAAKLAKKSKAKKLALVHISQRYKEEEEILKEARKNFKNVIVAKDFLKLEI